MKNLKTVASTQQSPLFTVKNTLLSSAIAAVLSFSTISVADTQETVTDITTISLTVRVVPETEYYCTRSTTEEQSVLDGDTCELKRWSGGGFSSYIEEYPASTRTTGKFTLYAVDNAGVSQENQERVMFSGNAGVEVSPYRMAGKLIFSYNGQLSSKVDAMNTELATYRSTIETTITSELENELGAVIDNLNDATKQYEYIDGAIVNGCVALFQEELDLERIESDTDYKPEYKLLCEDTQYKSLDSYETSITIGGWGSSSSFSFSTTVWGEAWWNSVSSIKMGLDTQLKLFSDEYYDGSKVVLNGDDFDGQSKGSGMVYLSEYEIDDDTESLKFFNLSD
ncbi:MAG: hypothetical protein GQ582_08260 [Methyloprofundus sp.]|nr:hypothetical protein [Methyloprofundus sp.]